MAITSTIEDALGQGVAALIEAGGIEGLAVVTSDEGEEPQVPFALVSVLNVIPVNDYSRVQAASVRVSVYESSKQRSSFLGISWGAWKTTRQTMFKAVRDILHAPGFKANLASAIPGLAIYEVIKAGVSTEPEGRKINNITDLKIFIS